MMNIISLNIKGCGVSSKQRLNQIINKGPTYMVFIQETKIQYMNEYFVMCLSENKDVG